MKTLVLVRHGKSSWDHPELKDYHRPLIQRGVNNAFSIAAELINLGIQPDLIVSSPAVRALDTAIIIATNMAYPLDKIATDATIYEASIYELLEVISQINDQYETVFLFGHNPGFTELVNKLQTEMIFNLPTCGTVGIELAINTWAEIKASSGKQIFKLIPKELI